MFLGSRCKGGGVSFKEGGRGGGVTLEAGDRSGSVSLKVRGTG